MKNIAISTINNHDNYGNRLQNYATQEVLKSLGFHVDTIKNYKKPITEKSFESKIKKFPKLKGRGMEEISSLLWKKIDYKFKKSHYDTLNRRRIAVFQKFTENNINETNYNIFDEGVLNHVSNRYKFFITGSDQVWNPNFRHGSPIDFLTFVPIQKRISYAASFGISEIPKEYVHDYKLWLSNIPKLSVREEAGAKIIKDLTGREATVLIDPTLMLTKEQWLSISNAHVFKPSKKYLLTYFLGGISKQKKKFIKDVAKKNDLEVVNLAQVNEHQTYLAGPAEFIDYINSSSVLFTDSFHGAVFSILMEKPFIVFDRDGNLTSMNSRMDTLLSKFDLTSRLQKNIENNNQIFEVNYSHINSVLVNERNKTIKYLNGALQVDVI